MKDELSKSDQTLRCTLAMEAGITDHVLTVAELVTVNTGLLAASIASHGRGQPVQSLPTQDEGHHAL